MGKPNMLQIANFDRLKSPVVIIIALLCLSIGKANAQSRPADTAMIDSMIFHVGEIQTEEPDSAMSILLEAEALAHGVADSIALMRISNFKGLDAYYKADFEQAAGHYFRSLKMAERHNRGDLVGIVSNNLGTLYFDLKELDRSQVYFERAYDIMHRKKNFKWLANITGNQAGIAYMKGSYEEAIELLKVSITYGIKAGNFRAVAGAYGNLAMVYTNQHLETDALETFERGVSMLDSAGDKRGISIVLNKLSRLQFSLGDREAAISTANKALELAEKIGNAESISNTHENLSAFLEETDPKASLEHLKAHIIWRDSARNERKVELLTLMEEKYQSEKKGETIAKLKAQSELSASRSDRQRLQIYLLLIIVLGSIAISILVYRQLLTNRKKNELIEQALHQKTLMMREMHHRVKNNFQMLSGLLMIKAESSKEPNVKRALMRVRERIQLMSITHQKLYQSPELSKIDSKAFITELVDEITNTWEEPNCEVNVHIEEEQLPVDTAISLGLIISEAITNSLKHAFRDTAHPKIDIRYEKGNGSSKLSIKDNGSGFDASSVEASFGIKMIENLVAKIPGTMNWVNDNGSTLNIHLTWH